MDIRPFLWLLFSLCTRLQGKALQLDVSIRVKYNNKTAHKHSKNVAEANGSTPRYVLQVLNEDLPSSLEHCYIYVTKKFLEETTRNPAELGYKVCQQLGDAARCARNSSYVGNDEQVTLFNHKIEKLREIICNPDCPFAQVYSCKTTISGFRANPSHCWFKSVSSCVDLLFPTLKCRPGFKAQSHWLVQRAMGMIKTCSSFNADCVKRVERCLQPVQVYLDGGDRKLLCKKKWDVMSCFEKESELCSSSGDPNVGEVVNHLKKELLSVCQSCQNESTEYSIIPEHNCTKYVIKARNSKQLVKRCTSGKMFNTTVCSCTNVSTEENICRA